MITPEAKALIKVENLKKYFYAHQGLFHGRDTPIKAVDGVSFQILSGETFALIGESGCGKTTLGRSILRLYENNGGKILYDGCDISSLRGNRLLLYRKKMQMIFQDPFASLNPRMTVSEIIGEAQDIHKVVPAPQKNQRINQLLGLVGLCPQHSKCYPHQFSSGQRQRISIARALAVEPEFIVCDEPTSSLDVSIQAQIINLLQDLQEALGLTYLYITHDLSLVRQISNRIGVLFSGRMMELSPTSELFQNPLHPYTKELFSPIIPGNPFMSAAYLQPPHGCPFSARCTYSRVICEESAPECKEVSSGHMVACHRISEIN